MGPYRSCGRAGAALRPGLTASMRSVLPAVSWGRTLRSRAAARSALRSRLAPPATRWVSTMWSLLIVWVRVFTRSSRCSTRARNAVVGIDLSAIEKCGRRCRPTPRRRRHFCGRVQSRAAAPVPRAWRGHRRHQCRRREAEWSTASQGRSHLRSPKRPLRFWPMGVRRWVSVRRGGVLGTPDGTYPSGFRRRWLAPPIRPVCG